MIQSPRTPDEQSMLIAWQQHAYTKFALRDPEATLATMTENPHVLLVPSRTGGEGRKAVRDFYANAFFPNIPLDLELTPLSRLFGRSHLIEESMARFTHSMRMDWVLPGLEPSGRHVEFVLVSIVGLQEGKVAFERLYWDQATVLSQLGALNHSVARAGIDSAATLLQMTMGKKEALQAW